MTISGAWESAKALLFDMDGTIYLGNRVIPGARELIFELRERSIPYYFLTNNSSRSQSEYVDKLRSLGFEVEPDQIISSGEATARYLTRRAPGARIFVMGTPSLRSEFAHYGFQHDEVNPEYLILGFDTTLNYPTLRAFCDFIRNGLPYIATHPDINCPTDGGLMPDIGSIMALIKASTGREPDVIIGKPNHYIVDAIAETTGLRPEQIMMVGDRLYTDMALGQAGLITALVLSGETKEEDLDNAPFKPDLIFQSVADLRSIIEKLG